MMYRTVQTTGAALNLRDTGDGERTFLFLHYWGGSSRTWRLVTERLDDRVRCVEVDQRGWGGSIATDGRNDLHAMADDVQMVVDQLGLRDFVLVGHSMGGKVAQIVAARRPAGLTGLVLVAPAPPTPMKVPAEQRAAMLASYETREGVLQALSILAASPLHDTLREQVIADTLRGTPEAKCAWIKDGMDLDISTGHPAMKLPVHVVVGSHDQVEREAVLRKALPPIFPNTTFTTLPSIGHLSPLEAPEGITSACLDLLHRT